MPDIAIQTDLSSKRSKFDIIFGKIMLIVFTVIFLNWLCLTSMKLNLFQSIRDLFSHYLTVRTFVIIDIILGFLVLMRLYSDVIINCIKSRKLDRRPLTSIEDQLPTYNSLADSHQAIINLDNV